MCSFGFKKITLIFIYTASRHWLSQYLWYCAGSVEKNCTFLWHYINHQFPWLELGCLMFLYYFLSWCKWWSENGILRSDFSFSVHYFILRKINASFQFVLIQSFFLSFQGCFLFLSLPIPHLNMVLHCVGIQV